MSDSGAVVGVVHICVDTVPGAFVSHWGCVYASLKEESKADVSPVGVPRGVVRFFHHVFGSKPSGKAVAVIDVDFCC